MTRAGETPCAGTLFLCNGSVLLLHRTDRDEWEGPGGHVERGETELQAALRETQEEIGAYPDADWRKLLTTHANGIRYTTFAAATPERFAPDLNEEHDRGAWFPVNDLPSATHPGVRANLSEWREMHNDAQDWRESDHPRGKDGKFGSGGGGSSQPKLTPTEKSYLASYSGDGFFQMNARLRDGDAPDAAVKSIDSAINKSELRPGTKLYRGMPKDAAIKLFGGRDIQKGQVIEDKGFQSTGKSYDFVSNFYGRGGVVLDIEAGDGQRGLDMGSVSHNQQEGEVLLPRDTKMEITGIQPPKKVGDPVVVRVRTLPSNTYNDAQEPLTELDIARAVRDGASSPARFHNVWLFDLRVTGTGLSYRGAVNEYVYRPPEFYLNDDFLVRMQGLPVIFMHPKKSMLNTEEYRDRNVGSLMLPYIPARDDEWHRTTDVWAVARIYDADAAELMRTTHPSTSPGVTLPKNGNRRVRAPDGRILLIENEPEIFDHVAVCDEGVWDKGDEPRGIRLD